MTQMLAGPAAALHRATVQRMASGVAAVDALDAATRSIGREVAATFDFDLLRVRASVGASAAASLCSELSAAAKDGHRASAQVESADASLLIEWTSTGRATVALDGSVGDLAAQENVAALDRARSRNDPPAALSLLGAADCNIELVLRAPIDGARWIPEVQMLAERLSDGRWGSTLLRLRSKAESLPAVVVVQNAGDRVLRCPGLILAGPAARLDASSLVGPAEPTSARYRQAPSRTSFRQLFVPEDLLAEPGPAGPLELLRPLLEACARACCWYWLGASATVTVDQVLVEYDGVRAVQLSLLPYDSVIEGDEVSLFTWATATSEPVRDDAVQQAVTFAIRDQKDLPGAAGPVLRTARSLHELAGRGAVAEALSARRGARDAAVTAARSAAEAARDVAAKSVERALALVLAAVLALIANAQKLLDAGAAEIVICAVTAMALIALVVAERIELGSGSRLLDAFDKDVELYREALGEDDIDAVRRLSAVSSARSDLSRSRKAIRWVYIGVAFLVLVGGNLQILTEHPVVRRPVAPASINPHPSRVGGSARPPAILPSRTPRPAQTTVGGQGN